MNSSPFIWDHFSDQPSVIKDKNFKRQIRKAHLSDFLCMFGKSLFFLPLAFGLQKFQKAKLQIKDELDFYGLGVNLDKGECQNELIDELGVRHLLIRIPLWDIQNIDKYAKFAEKFKAQSLVFAILQDRENISDLKLFKQNLHAIFSHLSHLSCEFQIGNAINRLKWGFYSPKEYLAFYKVAQNLRDEKFPHIKLIGPSVIDFEYYYNVALMFEDKNIKYDITNALLYVDRRGNPHNRQALFFDLKNKIDLLYSLMSLSCNSNEKLYITETNYPITNTAPYAPTSQKECITNELYAKYMLIYHNIARKTNKVARIYWHQLVAPGYGLVDNRNNKIIKLPQFFTYKEMINHARN